MAAPRRARAGIAYHHAGQPSFADDCGAVDALISEVRVCASPGIAGDGAAPAGAVGRQGGNDLDEVQELVPR